MIPKYRGKRIGYDDWVYGMPLHLGERCWIANGYRFSYFDEDDFNPHLTMNQFEVDPATVGQWTGLQDKNGIDVYDGDIVKGQSCGRSEPVFDYLGVVEYFKESHAVGWHVVDKDGAAWELQQVCARISMDNISGCVIGNIHENKDTVKP